jgi:hypothetical protein
MVNVLKLHNKKLSRPSRAIRMRRKLPIADRQGRPCGAVSGRSGAGLARRFPHTRASPGEGHEIQSFVDEGGALRLPQPAKLAG